MGYPEIPSLPISMRDTCCGHLLARAAPGFRNLARVMIPHRATLSPIYSRLLWIGLRYLLVALTDSTQLVSYAELQLDV
jgi:hypothetical protein